ncbi:cyclin-like protein [Naematelia encephala]|uniref:Cyclin-like protein n=1 Tax=Naematelia encephala TaxID=71784 RepID=A0A1Y2B876_9TREE|nr:cyclin-like protein [Naematelia encephala]
MAPITRQTRRLARRADENAPPSLATNASTRAAARSTTTLAPALPIKASTNSSLPVLKRHHSSSTATAGTTGASGVSGKVDAAAKKRSALGEVQPSGKNGEKDKLKAGVAGVKERKPLLSKDAQPQRKTRSSAAPVEVKQSLKDEKPLQKRKNAGNIRPTVSRAGSTTSTSTIDTKPPLKERRSNFREESQVEPIRKKRKTSSPALVDDWNVDELADEGLYDEDGKEVLLSSGQKGTALQSPKRARAKDEGWNDLDAEDEGDPTMVSEYVVDAFNYMMKLEKLTMPDPTYMDRQAELKWEMRAVLMSWLIEVHQKFRLLPETLFIAINLVDRFLSLRVVSMTRLQLVGLTGMFIAAKYEEVICPSVTHFLQMADGGYELEDMLKAERYMLSTLEFDLSYPNPLHFLRRVSKADGYDIQSRTLGKYLVEISVVEPRLLPYPPSLLAAAGMYLARMVLERGEWTPNLVHYSGYSVEELLECAQIMFDYVVSPDLDTNSAFHRKYASKKHLKASIFVRNWAVERFPDSANGTSDIQGQELRIEYEDGLPVTP